MGKSISNSPRTRQENAIWKLMNFENTVLYKTCTDCSTVTLYIIQYFQNSSISIWRFLVSCEASLRWTSPFCVPSLPLLTFLDLSSFKKFQKTSCMQTSLVTKKTLPLCFSSFLQSVCRLSLLILLLLLLSLSSFNSAFIFSRLRRRKEECSSSSTTHNTYI
jgi:hypothetical protein